MSDLRARIVAAVHRVDCGTGCEVEHTPDVADEYGRYADAVIEALGGSVEYVWRHGNDCDHEVDNAEVARRMVESGSGTALSRWVGPWAPVPEEPLDDGATKPDVTVARTRRPDYARAVEEAFGCTAGYERPGGRELGDRIVRCHLPAGHPGEHEEADTEITWLPSEPTPKGAKQ